MGSPRPSPSAARPARLLVPKIVWELVSVIEEQQELAARARETVLAKLRETLDAKMKKHEAAAVSLN